MRHRLSSLRTRRPFRAACCALVTLLAAAAAHAQNPLPSWNDTDARQRIVDFVESVTAPDGADFVPERERIAVFDNDGTLWAEQPMYFQLAFALDRIRAMAPDHPDWATTQPYRSILEGDLSVLSDRRAALEIVAATHAGMTTEEFAAEVQQWIATAQNPRFNRRYADMAYQPMIELLEYLRANGFKTFIVSGGGVEFMRGFAEDLYGIPPEQVIGSSGKVGWEPGQGGAPPVLRKTPQVEFVDDAEGKPVGINRFIGRRPVFAFGNSDGDLQMLQWTAAGQGPRFMALLHHTDAAREAAYDRGSPVGALDAALDEANARGWLVVDMAQDWNDVFAGD